MATNDTVFLTCGLMEATFTQWFNGKTVIPNESTPVQGSEDDTITVIGGSASLAFLSIFPFKASTHAGKYFCLVGLKGMNAIHTCPAELSHASEWWMAVEPPTCRHSGYGGPFVRSSTQPESSSLAFVHSCISMPMFH